MATRFYPPRSNGDFRLQERGYHVVYRDNQVNHCPGCSRSNWLIGRLLAECAFCETALPLESGLMQGHHSVRHTGRPFAEEMLAA